MLAALTVIVGIIPGSLVAAYSGLLLVGSLAGLVILPWHLDAVREQGFRGIVVAVLAITLPAMGLVGYATLWRAAVVQYVTPRVALALVAGILGAVGGFVRMEREFFAATPLFYCSFGGPILMALVHLGRYLRTYRSDFSHTRGSKNNRWTP